jgi:hypothetical protein
MGWQPNYQTEARIYGQYLLRNYPHGKIAILCQNDDYGKDYVKGLKDSLAGAIPIVAEVWRKTFSFKHCREWRVSWRLAPAAPP